MTDSNGWNDNTQVSFTKNNDGTYSMELIQNQWVFQNNMPDFPQWGNWKIDKMTDAQKEWFENNYGITLS